MEGLDKIKERVYRTLCFKYGILTLCYLITEYSKKENFEECQIILNAINSLKKDFDTDFPTKFDKDAIDWYDREIRKMVDKRTYVTAENLPHYAKELASEVKKTISILERQSSSFEESNSYKRKPRVSSISRIKRKKK